MLVILTSSVIALILTYLEVKQVFSKGMLCAFALMTFLACIHYDVGNDYMSYLHHYEEIVRIPFNLTEILEGNVYHEAGWALLNYLFVPFGGFFTMVAVLNLIQNILVYRFIRRIVDRESWAFSVFLYLFMSNHYLLSLSMMRQELVMVVFLSLWPWIKDRKFIRCALILYVCSYVHTSAFILIPFAFWGFLPFKRGVLMSILYFIIFVLLWFSGSFLNDVMSNLMQFEEVSDYMQTYEDSNKVDSFLGLGFLINLVPFFVFLYYIANRKSSLQCRALVGLACIGTFMTPFAQILSLIGRVGMYFGMYQIAALPIAYNAVQNPLIRIGLKAFLFVSILYGYYLFFTEPPYDKYYATFRTIFEVI